MIKLFQFFEFAVFYLKEIICSNLRVAYDVLTPRHHMRPEILDVDVTGLTDRQKLVLVNLVTMTPGSISIDLSDDSHIIRIHAMYVENIEVAKQDLVNNYVRRVKNVF